MSKDNRVDWFRPRIRHLLGLREADNTLIDELLRTDAAASCFKSFLNGGEWL